MNDECMNDEEDEFYEEPKGKSQDFGFDMDMSLAPSF